MAAGFMVVLAGGRPIVSAKEITAPLGRGQTSGDPARTYDLSFAVSGNPGPEDDFNPNVLVYQRFPASATKVLAYINYVRPRTEEDIRNALHIPEPELGDLLAALLRCDLIRHDPSEGYRLTFAVFDDAVWAAFDPIVVKMAGDISQRVGRRIVPELRSQYESSGLEAQGIPLGILGTLVIGAFGLDEASIQALESHELVRIRKRQPGERNYVVLAQSNDMKTRHRTWGIHGTQWNGVYFGVFGENSVMNRRRKEVRALPDVAWNWLGGKDKDRGEIDRMLQFIGCVVRSRGNREFSALDLAEACPEEEREAWLKQWAAAGILEEKDGRYKVRPPVFPERPFKPIYEEIARTAVQVVQSRYGALEKAYKTTTPFRHGVPLPEALDLVYHAAYSLALDKILSGDPELTFSDIDGPLKYTGYAILR